MTLQNKLKSVMEKSVCESIWNSAGDFVRDTVSPSVWISVGQIVLNPVRNSIPSSVQHPIEGKLEDYDFTR